MLKTIQHAIPKAVVKADIQVFKVIYIQWKLRY